MTISAHDQHVLDRLEHCFQRSSHSLDTGARNRSLLPVGLAVGVALILVGLGLDHLVGFVAAVAGFAAVTLCLSAAANLIARPWLGDQTQRLPLRRYSRF